VANTSTREDGILETWLGTHYTLAEPGHLVAEVKVVEGIHELPVMDWGLWTFQNARIGG
jgi:hypothetical protein